MRITAIMAGAALMAFAVPASAQVVGGLGGQVTGGATARTGDLGVRDTLGGARDLARDTVSDTRDIARDRDVRAGADVSTDASASASRDGVAIDFEARVGADVRSSGGDPLGQVVGVARDTAGRTRQVLIRGADGVVRGVEATQVSADASGALTSDLTAYQFRRQPEMADDGRRDPTPSNDDSIS